MMFARFDPQNIPEIVRCGPIKLGRCYVADVVAMDPFEEIKGYTGNVLIVHGTADKIVNVTYAEQAYEIYNRRGIGTAELHLIENGEHMFSKKHDGTAMQLLKKFME